MDAYAKPTSLSPKSAFDVNPTTGHPIEHPLIGGILSRRLGAKFRRSEHFEQCGLGGIYRWHPHHGGVKQLAAASSKSGYFLTSIQDTRRDSAQNTVCTARSFSPNCHFCIKHSTGWPGKPDRPSAHDNGGTYRAIPPTIAKAIPDYPRGSANEPLGL
jgi:hypothetical protein